MHQNESLPIPPPAVVRDRLARNLRENRLLRSLLRVSERAAEEVERDNTTRREAAFRAMADERVRRHGGGCDC